MYIVKGIMALEMTKEERRRRRRRRSSKCYTREIGNGGIPWNWIKHPQYLQNE
jgi:hypothetical protein